MGWVKKEWSVAGKCVGIGRCGERSGVRATI